MPRTRDGTGSPGHGSAGHWVRDLGPGRVGSRVKALTRLFDPDSCSMLWQCVWFPLDDYKAALSHDLAKYIGMRGPFEIVSNCQPQPSTSAARIQDCDNVFDPLSWWSKSSCKLPLLCKLAKQILVIPASSAESERHFSTAGKIARKDRAHLSSSAVEASVLVAQALKKGYCER